MLGSDLPLARNLLALLALSAAGASCRRPAQPVTPPALEQLDGALRPAAQVVALRTLSGMHLRAVTTFRVAPRDAPRPAPTPAGPATATATATDDRGPADSITTTTELWLDRHGHYRLVESNDEDGGREIVLHGPELAVAVRPGHATRRPAQEPEPTRYLEEATGGPWAAWETVRRHASVTLTAPGTFKIERSPAAQPVSGSTSPLRRWRDTVEVSRLEGEARLDPRSGALLAFTLLARFSARRAEVPLEGELSVTSKLDGIGATAAITAAAAEPLKPRQRTVLEERALLGDLVRGKEAPSR